MYIYIPISIGVIPNFLQNAILSLMKRKSNIRSLPVKELSKSLTFQLFLSFLVTSYKDFEKEHTHPHAYIICVYIYMYRASHKCGISD